MNRELFEMSTELMRLRGERRVMVELLRQLLSVALTLEAEGDDEEAGLQALIQHTRNALSAIHAEHLPTVEWAALMPEEPPAATLGFLIGMDSLEHMSEQNREVLSNRARMRWTALRQACRGSKPAGDAL